VTTDVRRRKILAGFITQIGSLAFRPDINQEEMAAWQKETTACLEKA
jgi:hypothetical protein